MPKKQTETVKYYRSITPPQVDPLLFAAIPTIHASSPPHTHFPLTHFMYVVHVPQDRVIYVVFLYQKAL